ncbi:PocR ligand-binding domain-containing protein [Oceanicoccus sp. KOV_DT_Chl]|uniref:PocR ligand-binding domain-containing protein n=1 Tax=Oceanicoccus sp. KOV_DT_Chl TaxID=1904639 RepID=UPI000C7C73AF|nr:PocR ligand-binding domain-containing protein [Oceanicoccus sp. KOV_DT_Chl]
MQKPQDLISTDGMPFSVSDVLDIAKLTPLFNSYTNITDVAAALLDLDGEVLIAANWKDSCTQFHRQNEITSKRCLQSDTALANDLKSGGKYNVYYCKNGLVDVATPVVIDGYHIANVFIGQFFFDPPDLEFYRQQAASVGFDEASYLDAIRRVPIYSEDEVQRNMEFIVQLAVMIGEAGVQHLNIQQANDELHKAKEQAEVASEAKTVFLSRMSHELRTPLNAVLGFSELLKMDIAEVDTEQQQLLDHIINAGDHLLTLIIDIMDVVCLDNQSLKIPLSDISLKTAVGESVAMVRPMAEDHGIDLQVEDVDLCVFSNSRRLKQVLINLLSNGIKYNCESGRVTITAEHLEKDQVKISVIDTGVGILPEETKKLFQPFTRLPYAEKSAIQGTGIGLSLCKYLVEEMRGDIKIEPIGQAKGSCFSVTLPMGQREKILLKNEIMPDQGQAQSISKVNDIEGSILYIEDSAANRKLLEVVARKYPSLIFESSSNMVEGLQLAERMNPSLIILDINMPTMSGVEAVKLMRKNPAFSNTKIVALSADALPDHIEHALQAGFDDYYTKPIDFPKITNLFRSIQSQPLLNV